MGLAFHVENFGCRAARADGEAVSARLRTAGNDVAQPANADVVIVNTCSVTAEADREARAYIRRAHRINPGARIVVTGCYAQRAPEELAGLPGVAAVVGNSHKALAPEIVVRMAGVVDQRVSESNGPAFVDVRSFIAGTASGAAPGGVPIWADDRFAHSFLEEAQLVPGTQTRPNLKIQEGCGNRCTFCVIPQTRGNSRSLPAESVLKQVRGFAAAGGNELVLSGINLGRWGRDLAGADRMSLAGLVRRIFDETNLARLRLSSIEPMDWDSDLIALMGDFGGTRLARHAHLPLQSGSDAVLRRMHRRYRPWHYSEKVRLLTEAAGPRLTLGADVMVGFPGESDCEFEETCAFIRELPFGYLHLFPFSARPGTRAWELHKEVPVTAEVVEERMAALRALASEKVRVHRMRFPGRVVEAITLNSAETIRSRSCTAALTENFRPLEIEGELESNVMVRVRVARIASDSCLRGVVES
ncbi:MAG TPA: radical SAM protein [Terracidiphilus sp.]|nr:radical SAM protein [Terracidiphilus sp.]